ncbi:MAG TPA: selenide, water dikinase SelD [Firmicutes bacterium]|nr:selenide, water dikinase SelD [Bacillota bacterium]
MGPETLSQVLRDLPVLSDPRLLVGHELSDDAAVYRLTSDLALIQTLDFFTPVVDDPFVYGQIAAANALSDVYAMGGQPLLALNIVCFPSCLDPGILRDILRGGADKAKEAGALLVGGHSLDDQEPKYGLAVTGIVKPEEVWSNAGAAPGDVLVLTKPIGTGLFLTAYKVDLVSGADFAPVGDSMAELNAAAAAAARETGISACTDITGFGLLGHGYELAVASGVDLHIYADAVPVFDGAAHLARQGLVPAGTYRNRDHLVGKVTLPPDLAQEQSDLLFDPQTSGGLLLSVPAGRSRSLVEALARRGIEAAAIGEVAVAQAGKPRLVVL